MSPEGRRAYATGQEVQGDRVAWVDLELGMNITETRISEGLYGWGVDAAGHALFLTGQGLWRWNPEEGGLQPVFQRSLENPRMDITPGKSLPVIAERNGRLWFWEPAAGPILSLTTSIPSVRVIALRLDGRGLALVAGGRLRLYRVEGAGREVDFVAGRAVRSVRGIAAGQDRLVVLNRFHDDGHPATVHGLTWEGWEVARFAVDFPPWGVLLEPGEDHVLLFNWRRLERWGLANGRREAATTRLPLVQSALSPDGRWLALWDYWDTTLGLVDLQEGRVQFTRDLDNAVYGVGFSPDGSRIAARLSDESLVFLTVPQGDRFGRISSGAHRIDAWFGFDPEGRGVLGQSGRKIGLWPVGGDQPLWER